jgi:hypothetical protein
MSKNECEATAVSYIPSCALSGIGFGWDLIWIYNGLPFSF